MLWYLSLLWPVYLLTGPCQLIETHPFRPTSPIQLAASASLLLGAACFSFLSCSAAGKSKVFNRILCVVAVLSTACTALWQLFVANSDFLVGFVSGVQPLAGATLVSALDLLKDSGVAVYSISALACGYLLTSGQRHGLNRLTILDSASPFACGILLRQANAWLSRQPASAQNPVACMLLMLVLGMLLALASLWIPSPARSDAENNHGSLSSAICPLAAGSFFWSLSSRVVPIESPYYAALAGLCAVVMALHGAYQLLCAHRGVASAVEQGDGKGPSDKIRELLLPYGLSPRQLEVSVLYASGKTAKEIADALGIKPATVRVTLLKSYEKIGVSTGAEMRSLLGQGISVPESDEVRTSERGRETLRPSGAYLTAYCLLGLIVLSGAIAAHRVWGAGRPLLYGIALGLGLAGGVTLSAAANDVAHKGGDGASPSRFACALPVFSLVGLASLALMSLFGVWLAMLDRGIVFAGSLLGSLSIGMWACAWSGRLFSHGEPSRLDKLLSGGLQLVSLGVGLLIEEAWRGTQWHNAFGALELFSLLLVASYSLVLYKSRKKGWSVALLGLVLLFVALDLRVPLVAESLLAYVLMLARGLASRRISPVQTAGCLLAFGVGIVAGDIAVNYVSTAITLFNKPTYLFGGVIPFAFLCYSSAAVLASFLGAASVLATARLLFDALDDHIRDGLVVPERIEHAMLARGLNETQAKVAAGIVLGLTSDEIARNGHLSRGAVNSARSAVYSRLGIHSRDQLVRIVANLLGLASSEGNAEE